MRKFSLVLEHKIWLAFVLASYGTLITGSMNANVGTIRMRVYTVRGFEAGTVHLGLCESAVMDERPVVAPDNLFARRKYVL